MRKILIPGGLAVAMIAAPALAQPSPAEQQSMHIGSAATNGSATIITDRYGTHPDGFVGMATVNSTSAAATPHRRHHHHAYRETGR